MLMEVLIVKTLLIGMHIWMDVAVCRDVLFWLQSTYSHVCLHITFTTSCAVNVYCRTSAVSL